MRSDWTPTHYDQALADKMPLLTALDYLASKKHEHDEWQRAAERNTRERAAWWQQVPRTNWQ